MDSILVYIIILAVCAFILFPLFRRSKRSQQIGQVKRTRAAELLHKKRLILDTLKDLEFDRSTGKLSEEDFEQLHKEHENSVKQIDEQLRSVKKPGVVEASLEKEIGQITVKMGAGLFCSSCGKRLQKDDKFCSRCGAKVTE
jgi:cytochrome c-type biogenesis protein CcmI